MDIGPTANERARQIVYSIRRWTFFKEFLATSVQGERCSPTRISRFLGFGELCGPTDPSTDQIGTQGLVHIKEHVNLHILLGGGTFPWSSWLVGAGVWEFPTGISKFLAVGGTLAGNGCPHRLAMGIGVGAY